MIPSGLLFASNGTVPIYVQIPLWVQGVFSIITLFINFHLVAFHIWISSKGLSTYDYIGYKKNLKEKQAELKAGIISEKELKDWKQTALIFPEKRKSSIVMRKNINYKTVDFVLRSTPRNKEQPSAHSITVFAEVPKRIRQSCE